MKVRRRERRGSLRGRWGGILLFIASDADEAEGLYSSLRPLLVRIRVLFEGVRFKGEGVDGRGVGLEDGGSGAMMGVEAINDASISL